MCIFALLGTMMYCSKLLMEALPNIHLIGMFTMVCAIVYRGKGLIPIYVFVFLQGLLSGFSMWWIPYLYIWTILWVVTMLLPKKMPPKIAVIVYPIVCGLFGLAYGTLYAPTQAILFNYNFATTLKWIAAGFYFDVLHGIGNIGMGLLVYPLSRLLIKLNTRAGIN